jgi:hypothetical protein
LEEKLASSEIFKEKMKHKIVAPEFLETGRYIALG